MGKKINDKISEFSPDRQRKIKQRAARLIKVEEELRAISWSIDVLLPGFYLWYPGGAIRLGGAMPDDRISTYPGSAQWIAPWGIVVILPGIYVEISGKRQ